MVTRPSRYEHAGGRTLAPRAVGSVVWFQLFVLALVPILGVPHLHVERGGATVATRAALQHSHGIGLQHADSHDQEPAQLPAAVENLDEDGLVTEEEHPDTEAAAAHAHPSSPWAASSRLKYRDSDGARVRAAPPRALGYRAEVRLAPQRRGPPAASD